MGLGFVVSCRECRILWGGLGLCRVSLDPTKYYDAAHDQVIDLLALTADFAAQRDSQIAEIRKEVEQKCDGTTQFIQSIVDLAVARYTKDLSIILPRHMTHIDVNEILKGHLLGGPNSVFNEVKNSVYRAMGMGENNDLRNICTTRPNSNPHLIQLYKPDQMQKLIELTLKSRFQCVFWRIFRPFLAS